LSNLKKIIVLIDLFLVFGLYSQGIPIFFKDSVNGSMRNCDATSIDYLKKYKLQSFYIPTSKDPVITFKITVHIFTKNDGTGHWENSMDSLKGHPLLKRIFDTLTNGHCERYSDRRNANYKVKGFKPKYIKDSKIQFELTHIYFYADSNMYTTLMDELLFEHIKNVSPKRLEEGMPIVFNASRGPGHLSSYNGSPAVVTSAGAGFAFPFLSSHLRHEIAHCFGLYHTYYDGAGGEHDHGINCNHPDFLTDVFPQNSPHCLPKKKLCNVCEENTDTSLIIHTRLYSNNIMGGTEPNTWISPLQMGRRIRALHISNPLGGDIRKFVKDANSSHKNPLVISNNETWDFDYQMYKDILIKTGDTLTIKCKLAMAKNGKIILEKGAYLIVDGGEITTWCKSGYWYGLELKDKTAQMNSYIKLMNDGGIKKVRNL
jgi:hypothetical protein